MSRVYSTRAPQWLGFYLNYFILIIYLDVFLKSYKWPKFYIECRKVEAQDLFQTVKSPKKIKIKMTLNLYMVSKSSLKSSSDDLDVCLMKVGAFFNAPNLNKTVRAVLEGSSLPHESHSVNSQPDMHCHRGCSRRFSMMSSQITVSSLWKYP